ncbi:uncharacterized protein A1O9_05414 [Exophiala aquamarina CBS 119918]|uniref:Xylanolytic transcriptional activator regulatory domain-containing protein n=1 Tax=Exophiala aquamarina CBS 119918 TaxID=1182545 RepID=A0A072PCI8_9EURO|nr:uncharacterized protein A1O9_05414 [Exophiala aquamarina CBS 119918]KEF57497.1 hypothetical protein A1O9_05414 [Exophiala aquamarina CBS 119918]
MASRMTDLPAPQRLGGVRTKRYKTSLACTTCRARKLKCDGARPVPVPTNSLSLSRAEQPTTPDIGEPVGDTDPNDFATKVTEAIDTRLGLPAAKKRCLIPLTDAPLFGDVLPHHQPTNEAHNADNVLPPRKHADHLAGLYWLHLEPMEPLLDKDHFYTSYRLLFAGNELDCNEYIFVSTLNAIFALATQLQETIPSEQRTGMARTYFHRAWSLLRPESVLWHPASMDIVQCLLLIARILSWTLGRSSMLTLTACSFILNSRYGSPAGGEPVHPAAKMHDLEEIATFIEFSQIVARSSFAERLGIAPPTKIADLNTVMQIDECLNKLQSSHASLLLSGSLTKTDDDLDRQRFLFELRLAHARILLFRPILVRLCLSSLTPAGLFPDLEHRILQSCAMLCVENAQKVIDLVAEDWKSDTPIGILPWWYRVFYLWIATLHIIAAMMRPEIFESVVSGHWEKAISLLTAHEHLCQFLPETVVNFRSMWEKVMRIRNLPDNEVPPAEAFQDVFQHMGLEAPNLMYNFGTEDMTWLGNFEWDDPGIGG